MTNEQHPKNHPLLAYILGLIFLAMSLCVGAGVIYHLTLSHHGPGLLRPLIGRHAAPGAPVLTAEQRQAKLDRHRHFHNLVRYPGLSESQQPLCLICHSEMPHNKSKRIRALLNMHTQYLACQSCHIKTEDHHRVVFRWASPIDPAPEGPFAGTRYDDKTGYLAMVDDAFSKITPVDPALPDGPPSATADARRQSARDFLRARGQLGDDERKAAAAQFHTDTQAKGPDCQACHAENGILDYRTLDFSEKRIADLVHLNITGMLAKYESWYLPDLLSDTRAGGKPADGKDSPK